MVVLLIMGTLLALLLAAGIGAGAAKGDDAVVYFCAVSLVIVLLALAIGIADQVLIGYNRGYCIGQGYDGFSRVDKVDYCTRETDNGLEYVRLDAIQKGDN